MPKRKNRNFTVSIKIFLPVGIYLICGIFFFVMLKTFFCRYAYFNVSKVSIKGIEEDACLEFKRKLLGKNIFSQGLNSLKKQIEQAAGGVACISIERRLPGELIFTLKKRIAVAQVKFLRFYPVDESGMLMPGSSDIAFEGLPAIFGLDYKGRKANPEKYYSINEARSAITLILEKNNSQFLKDYRITKIHLNRQKASSFFIMGNFIIPVNNLSKNNFSSPEVEVRFDPEKPMETIMVLGLLLNKRKNIPASPLSAQGVLGNIEYIDLTDIKSPILLEKKEIKRMM